MIKSKMYIFIITFILCVFCFNSINTYATEGKTTYDITINRGPRISFDLTDSKNVIINVKDSQGVKSVKVEQYSNSKWKNITSKILVSKDKKQIYIPSKMINNKITLKITTINNSSINNYSKDVVDITKLSNMNEKGYYYLVNASPRIDFISTECKNKKSINSLIIKAKDGSGIKGYIIEDLNNKNKKYKYNISNKSKECYLTFSLKKLKVKNSKYYIVINVIDNSNNTHTEKIRFYIKSGEEQDSVKYIAHRGARSLAPENSTKSFELAGKNGAFGIETDIQATSDGELVCMHDATLDRTTNGKGKVSSKSLKSIRELRIDTGNNIKKYNNLKVPTFYEYLEICKKYNCYAIVELKTTLTQKYVKKAVDIIKKENMQDKCIIITFDAKALETIRAEDESIKIGYLVKNVSKSNINKAISLKNCAICPKDISKSLTDYAHQNGVEVNIWTIDTYVQKAKLQDIGVDYITTNIINM